MASISCGFMFSVEHSQPVTQLLSLITQQMPCPVARLGLLPASVALCMCGCPSNHIYHFWSLLVIIIHRLATHKNESIYGFRQASCKTVTSQRNGCIDHAAHDVHRRLRTANLAITMLLLVQAALCLMNACHDTMHDEHA